MKPEGISRKLPFPTKAIQAISTGLASTDELVSFFDFLDSGGRFELTSNEALELYKICNRTVVGRLIAVHEKLQLTDEEQKLLDALKNKDVIFEQRIYSAMQLAKKGTTAAISHLNSCLDSTDPMIYFISAYALAHVLKHPRALQALLELGATEVTEIPTRALKALSQIKDESILDKFIELFKDHNTNPMLGHSFLSAIGAIRSDKSFEALKDVLLGESQGKYLRMSAASYIGYYRNQLKALFVLWCAIKTENLQDQPDEELKARIMETMQRTQITEGSEFNVMQGDTNIGKIKITEVNQFSEISETKSEAWATCTLAFNEHACVPWQGCSLQGMKLHFVDTIHKKGKSECDITDKVDALECLGYEHLRKYLGEFRLSRP